MIWCTSRINSWSTSVLLTSVFNPYFFYYNINASWDLCYCSERRIKEQILLLLGQQDKFGINTVWFHSTSTFTQRLFCYFFFQEHNLRKFGKIGFKKRAFCSRNCLRAGNNYIVSRQSCCFRLVTWNNKLNYQVHQNGYFSFAGNS